MSNVTLSNISFPVFRVGETKPTQDSGVICFLQSSVDKEMGEPYRLLIVDDKNRPEPFLFLRRAALKDEGVPLYKLDRAIFFIGDLIKLAKPSTWFIDREGQLFQYKKSKRVPLVFRKITRCTRLQHGGALIEVQGFSQRFKTLFMPDASQTHAGLLLIDRSVILYGVYDQQYDDTVRAV